MILSQGPLSSMVRAGSPVSSALTVICALGCVMSLSIPSNRATPTALVRTYSLHSDLQLQDK